MHPPPGRHGIDLARSEDRERLHDMIWEIQPGLVILDDLFTITSLPRNWRAVRILLRFLNERIEEYGCTMLLINPLMPDPHRRKPSRTLTVQAAALLYLDWIQQPTPLARAAPSRSTARERPRESWTCRPR